jgi:hypothetical protein
MQRIRQRIRKGRLALLAGGVTLAACSDGSGPQLAQLSLALTDAPGDVDSVWVEIGEIYLQGSSGGRVTLLDASEAASLGLIELTRLAGTTLDLVSDVTIDVGNYGQLRFVVEGAVLETEDGEVFTYNATHPHGAPTTGALTCPSCSLSGIKVLLPGDVASLEAGAHIIVLDFDVSQSFGHGTGGTSWVMHPVIRGVEIEFSGAITGTVDVARDSGGNPLVTIPECPAGTPRGLSAFVPMAVAETLTDDLGDPIMASASVADDGTFAFPYLHPDGYDLRYAEEVEVDGSTISFTATAPGVVNVTDGGSVTVAYTITAASCS